jgi:hypothetical protein
MAIKHNDYEKARDLLDGKLGKFLVDDLASEELSYALRSLSTRSMDLPPPVF